MILLHSVIRCSSLLWVLCPLLLASNLAQAQSCDSSIEASTPATDFQFLPDGEVKHLATGLVWPRCHDGQSWDDNGTPEDYADDFCVGTATDYSWQDALNRVQQIKLTYPSARMPNIKELQSIIEYRCTQPAININVFPVFQSGVYTDVWTSSPSLSQGDRIWTVGFSAGGGQFETLSGPALLMYVR